MYLKVLHHHLLLPFINSAPEAHCIGQVNDHLKSFLEMELPKQHKSHPSRLGVSDPKLAGSIKDVLGKGYDFDTGEVTQDLLRGIRLHMTKLLKGLQPGDLEKAQLGLGHSYSRAKVKFNVNKSDNMIIQTIALLDQLDKDINTFAMRVRYSKSLSSFAVSDRN
jgi:nucleolar protein 56